uniref:LOW QUALITY PROTEIN: protein SWEETIE n=1 Tax=Elaeis guineensis var. tenera TaxID=51953 RepID=A0A8N4ES16_ELAGV|nr:LOW QUALITY PROTEIN: protein SWEETIE [Elaeis guineensis]
MARREIDAIPLSRFGVLVAQLESIVASAPQQPPDALLCFDLLSELIAAIEDEPKESIQQWQRKCEDALFSLLIFGARRPVRRLASSAMGRVIARGDGISIYSRASSLQGWLADGKRSEPLSCAGAAKCLGKLYHLFGRRITSGLIETTSIAAKLMKFHEDFVRQDAMQMLENALEGSGGSGASTAYSEAFRIIMRVGVNDKALNVRLAAARCLKTFASIGGPGLGITELENSIIHCVKALEDPVQPVRDAFAEALGALLALAMNPEAQIKQRGKNHPAPAKKLDDGLQKHLISPFIRASGVRAKEQRIGLALSWVFFLQVIRVKYHLPDSELQNFALLSMDMLQGDASLDAQALACVLYILRVGVTDQMTEPTQRSFLVFLGRKLESADCSPAMRVATLRILSYLLTTLGEVPVEFKDVLDNTVVAALSHSSLHVRIEAALTLRALAEVDPTCVGGLISYGVTTLHALRESARFEKGMHLNPELDSLHGQAAIVAALVSISPKLLLGYPARLPKSVFDVSKKMLTEYSRNPLAATVEKEAGWLLLASLIASMPKEELEDQVFDILLLWAGPFVGNPESYIGRIQDFTSELRNMGRVLLVVRKDMEELGITLEVILNRICAVPGLCPKMTVCFVNQTRSLLGELVAAADPNYIGSIALSLGCIHRSAGGMALSTLVPSTVSSLSSLAKSPNASLQLWALHALLLTIEAAGLSYVSQVQATLFLAMDILLSEENGLVDLRQEIGRLINAIVAVLGPELAPGSTFFSRCKSVIAEISSCQEISTLLESVRFTQQLVLFAPQAVSVHSHVQSLLPTLSSRQPSLRSLAVSTLHHLIEKDPLAMIDENIEENLFSMLDEETDSEIGSLVRATITRLLYASCPLCPSRWLAIFHNLVLATSTRSNSAENNVSSVNENSNGASERGANLYYGDDDEDMIAGSKGERIQGSVSASSVDTKREKHLRYRTRVFAAECLSCLPTAVGNDPAHFDVSLARSQRAKGRGSSGDWLVLHLQELVSLSYQISTGQFEGMQPIGVRLLSIIMDKFGRTSDPELPGHLLLEQYQAQLVSAVRSSISTSSGPLLLEAGLQLATKILTSSIVSGDRVALNRMFSLISRPLNDIKDLYYPSFAEWVACKIKVRLLAAHASIKCYVYQFLREQKGIPDEYLQLIPLFSTSSNILGEYWISILKDYSYMCFGLHPKFSYKPFLDGIQSLLVSSKVQECLHEAWPLILQATALDAIPMKFELDKSSKHDEDSPRTPFISGHSMVRLKLSEFQFLWGLSLLVLFQGQQLVSGNQGKMLLVHDEKKHSGDSMPQGVHYLSSFEIALLVFQSLSKEVFFSQEFLSLDLCKELLQVLISVDYTSASCNGLVIYLLSQIVKFCPDNYFHMDDFTTAATELYFKCLMVTFQSDNAILQDHSHSNELLSELCNAAEMIVYRLNHKNRWNLIMALISISRQWFRLASTNLLLSKAISFLQKLVPFMKRCFTDEAELHIDDYDHLMTVLGAWANMLTFLSQDCIKRICIMESKMGDSSKLFAKILVFCLEEVVALARLVHQSHHLQEYKANNHMLLFSIFKHCTKCVRDTFYVTNIQIQTLGLHVVKSIAQKELAEGSQVNSHSFLLLFIGELFRDVFLLIQHTLKEHKSRESVAITDECLRLLFLFRTLAQGSECQKAVMMLLLEALFMVFSLSNESLSQETSEVNTVARSMVSHLVQIPSAVIQIKDAILSMPVTRRQQIQDMIRASVTQYHMGTQVKLNVQPESDAREAHQVQASDFIVAPADKHDVKEEDDDDDDDWDAFQSLPANNVSASLSDSHVDWREHEAASVDDSSPAESDHSENRCHHHDLSHQNVFEEVTHEQSPATGTGEEVTTLVRNELVESSDTQYSENEEIIEDSGDIKVQELSKQSTNDGGDKVMGNDVDDSIGSAIQLMEDDDLIKEQHYGVPGGVAIRSDGNEDGSQGYSDGVLSSPRDNKQENEDQHLHHEVGSESRTVRNEDSTQEHSVDGLSAPKDNEKEDEDGHLHYQVGGEIRSIVEEGSDKHLDDVFSKDNERECDGQQHLHHERGGESGSIVDEDGTQQHGVNVIAATENNEQECEARHVFHQGGGELSSSGEICYGHSDDVPSAPNNNENETGGQHLYHEDDSESSMGPQEQSR